MNRNNNNNNNKNNNNNNNEQNKNDFYNPKYFNEKDMTFDDFATIFNKNPQEIRREGQIMEEIFRNEQYYLRVAARKVEVNENLKMTQYKTRRDFYELNMTNDKKELKNDNWFTSPVTIYLNEKWYNIENYKTSGLVVKGETKKEVVNFHALLALERRAIEHFVLQKVLGYNMHNHEPIKSMIDVYCSTRLAAIYSDKIRFHRPVIEARDIQRKAELEAKMVNNFDSDMSRICDCKLDDKICTHMETQDVLNFTHSLYYVKEKLINDALKKNKIITGACHIFESGEYDFDYIVAEDHLARIKRHNNKIEMTIMNDKTYKHPAILNYLWERNEFSFSNCTVQVYCRIQHDKFQHIGFAIYPFKNQKPDMTTDFRLHTSEESNDNVFYQDGVKNILGPENEFNFAQYYNSGKVGFLRVYNKDGGQEKDENGKDKYLLVRKLKNDFVFPKLINTEWTTFKSLQIQPDPKDFIYVKEELINSGLKTLVSTKEFDKAYDQILNKILCKVNTANPDIIVCIAMNILKTAYDLKTKLQFIKESDTYKGLESEDFKNYKKESWWRPIDKLKDKFINKQVIIKPDLSNDNFFTKRYIKLFKNKLLNTLKQASLYTKNYFSFEYINKFYNDKKLENYKHSNLQIDNLPELAFQDYHKPQDIIIQKHDPVKIQNLKEKIRQKIYFVDNYVLKNYLSAWSLVNQKIQPPEIKYSLDVKIDPRILFKPRDIDIFENGVIYQNQVDMLDKNNTNECLFSAIAMALVPIGQESNLNYVKLAQHVKRDAVRASLNNGTFHDFLIDGMKNSEYVEDLLDAWKVNLFILDADQYQKGNLKVIEKLNYSKNNLGTIMLLKNGNHLDVVRKQVYGSLKTTEVHYINSVLPNARTIQRRTNCCIDRKIYEENIVHLTSLNKDKFVCPIFPELSAYTTYEEFCNKVKCTCKGDMTLGFLLDDDKRDRTVVYYDQCPRIQIIAALRQILPQNEYDETLYKKLVKYADRLIDDRKVDELIAKYFTNIDYERWLQRCKPKYRRKILKYLNKKDDWTKIEEPNVVNGLIKEEVQDEGDKARGLGSPTILHKILMGPLESCFENLFRELFPDFWGVGESTNQKEYELNELAKKLHADKSVTLDISGLDQSHNRCVKMFWRKILDRVVDYLKNNKTNCVFNPDSIKRALDKESTIVVYKNKEYKRQKENKYETDSDSQYTVIIEIVEKMASGQGYTTVLNTSLMCFLMEFIRDEYYMNVGGKISGDDVALVTTDTREKWSKVLGIIFSKKGANNKGGVGLVLKYFRYGDLDTISPCSLLAFVCPIHGIRLVRQYHRYLKNFFYSQKMLNMPDYLRFDFFGTICQGERYWAKGYDAFNIINNWPTPNPKIFKELCKYFSNTYGGKKKYRYEGEDITEEKFAQKLFEKRGVHLDNDTIYWDKEDNFLFREANWLRNETIDHFKKIPVYECCNQALNDKLQEVDPSFLLLEPKDFMYAVANMEKYYDDMNCKVDYKYYEEDKYKIINYQQALDTCNDKYYYNNREFDSEFMMRKAIKNKYNKDMDIFRKTLKKVKNILTA